MLQNGRRQRGKTRCREVARPPQQIAAEIPKSRNPKSRIPDFFGRTLHFRLPTQNFLRNLRRGTWPRPTRGPTFFEGSRLSRSFRVIAGIRPVGEQISSNPRPRAANAEPKVSGPVFWAKQPTATSQNAALRGFTLPTTNCRRNPETRIFGSPKSFLGEIANPPAEPKSAVL